MYYTVILVVSILKALSLIPLLYEVYLTRITINIPIETLLMELVIAGTLLYIAAHKAEYLFFALFLVRFISLVMLIALKYIQERQFVWMYQ